MSETVGEGSWRPKLLKMTGDTKLTPVSVGCLNNSPCKGVRIAGPMEAFMPSILLDAGAAKQLLPAAAAAASDWHQEKVRLLDH